MVVSADRLRRGEAILDTSVFWVGAIGTSIHPRAGSRGLSSRLLLALKHRALDLGYRGLVAPVRPVFKARMPGVSVEEYARVRLPDGSHFDPWVRTHERLGARIVATCPVSASFRGSREQWEEWSGLKLPDRGEILLPEAIAPLRLEGGVGQLDEPSLWLEHRVEKNRPGI